VRDIFPLHTYTSAQEIPPESDDVVRRVFLKSELEQHLMNDCPLTSGTCSDCNVPVKRYEEETHMSSVEHRFKAFTNRVDLVLKKHPEIQLPEVESKVSYHVNKRQRLQ
jgi:hypothetical protein